MEYLIAGSVVRGCSTFAPKYDSSHASLYESVSRQTASLTFLGSAEYTPSTSVQIVIFAAMSIAPKMVAE